MQESDFSLGISINYTWGALALEISHSAAGPCLMALLALSTELEEYYEAGNIAQISNGQSKATDSSGKSTVTDVSSSFIEWITASLFCFFFNGSTEVKIV